MGILRHSRHQTNGKKTVHDVRTLNHTSDVSIFQSIATILVHGLKPEVVALTELAILFVPP